MAFRSLCQRSLQYSSASSSSLLLRSSLLSSSSFSLIRSNNRFLSSSTPIITTPPSPSTPASVSTPDSVSSSSSDIFITNPPLPIKRRIYTPRIPRTTGFILLIQEWWGIIPQLDRHAERLAKEGYQIIVPDLYHGKIGLTIAEATHLMNHLDFNRAINDIGSIITQIKEKNPTSKIATLGFCMGGALSLAAAASLPADKKLNAAISLYGIPNLSQYDVSKIDIPVQAHFGEYDSMAGLSDPATVDQLSSLINKNNNQQNFSIYRVPGVDHGYLNDTKWYDEKRFELKLRGGYQQQAAEQTWKKIYEFLKTNIY